MITITISIITILFILFIISRKYIEKIINHKLCALCASVSTTWIILLILRLLNFNIDNIIIAILMGESVTGIMYNLTNKNLKKANPIRNLFVIILGTALVYSVIKWDFEMLSLIVLVPVFLLTLITGISKKGPVSKFGKKLRKDLDKCCN